MKFLATIILSALFVFTVISQTTKPKTAVSKAKPVAKKGTPSDTKNKKVATKAKPVPSKSKTATTNKKVASKNNPAAPNPKISKGKTATAKPKTAISKGKPTPDPSKQNDEDAEFEKAMAVVVGTERIVALKKFIKTFPDSKRAAEASALIVTVEAQMGNDRLTESDIPGAVKFYKAAIGDAPKPVPDQLFTDTLAKFPANLYFRGYRGEAFELAKEIEVKSNTSVSQLLNIAGFYMSVENGSEAKRVAEKAIILDPASSAAYQTLGLANRIDFLLDESAAAYSKALELEPDSLAARRGLAEMKRSLGRSDDAVALYREILAKDEADLPARTGLVMALFDAGNRTDAEVELARALEENSGNVILLASAAYWYAANNEGDKAVDLAQKAVASDPRFIWSHIALARGYMAQKNPTSAEKALLTARRYGNFPTLEYEIASARAAAGFYREAAEELAKSFSVKDGVVTTKLGGRISRGSNDFTELVGFERRASIFAPTAADNPENSARMIALLELKLELDKSTPNPEVAAKAVDDFVRGDDKMKVHRLIFASTQLLDKKIALPKVVELTKAVPAYLDAGLEVSDPTASVMASELYESRSIAAARGEYISVPVVARPTLSTILRGRVEEINGWAHYQMDDPAQATIHLKRAVSVLPADSAWWHSSTWRLGTALVLDGKNAEAIEIYIRSYKSKPDPLRYNAIETLYKRINGHTMGLENRIGPNPTPAVAAETVSQRIEPTPPPIPIAVPELKPSIKPTPDEIVTIPPGEPKPTPSPAETKPSITPEPMPIAVPFETPKIIVDEPKVEPSPTPLPEPSPTPIPEETMAAVTETSPQPTPVVLKSPLAKETLSAKLVDNTNGLFPPVVITIPPPAIIRPKTAPSPTPAEDTSVEAMTPIPRPAIESTIAETKPSTTSEAAEIKPCSLTMDQDRITLQTSGNERAVVVRRVDDGDVEVLTAVSTNPEDVSVRREAIPGVNWAALFVLRSTSSKPGVFQVRFEAPCGKKEIVVRVQ